MLIGYCAQVTSIDNPIDCVIPESLDRVQNGSGDLKAHILSDDEIYLTAGSKLYKLTPEIPIDQSLIDVLENDRYVRIYKATSGLLVVTDRRLIFRVSSNHSREIHANVANEFLTASLFNVYPSKTYGTLFNFSGKLQHLDEIKLNIKPLLTNDDEHFNEKCVVSDDSFVAAVGDHIYYLTKTGQATQTVKMEGFSGQCNSLKQVGHQFLIAGYDSGFGKANTINKRFETIPGHFEGNAHGIFAVNDEILLATTTAVYELSKGGQIGPITNGEIGLLQNVYTVSNQTILHSLKGLYTWNKKDGIQILLESNSDTFNVFEYHQSIYVQQGQTLFRYSDKGLETIDRKRSANEPTFILTDVLELKSGPLFGTNTGAFRLSNDEKQILRLPGSPDTPVDQLFKSGTNGYVIADKRLFRVHGSQSLDDDVFVKIVPRSIQDPGLGKYIDVDYELNTEKYPCASNNEWITTRVERGGLDQKIGKRSADSTLVGIEKSDISQLEPNLGDHKRNKNIVLAARNYRGEEIRVVVITEKPLLDRMITLVKSAYKNNVFEYLAGVFLVSQLILARYFEWSFKVCFNLFQDTFVGNLINKWTHLILSFVIYRRWLLRRYFYCMRALIQQHQAPSSVNVKFIKQTSPNISIVSEKLLLTLQQNQRNIWIVDKSDSLESSLTDLLAYQCFVQGSVSQLWRKLGFVPLFISADRSAVYPEKSWIEYQARKIFIESKLNFYDLKSFQQMLKSRQIAIVIDGFREYSPEARTELIRYAFSKPNGRLLVISDCAEDDIADLFDIYTPQTAHTTNEDISN